jgi:hypothetical protein
MAADKRAALSGGPTNRSVSQRPTLHRQMQLAKMAGRAIAVPIFLPLLVACAPQHPEDSLPATAFDESHALPAIDEIINFEMLGTDEVLRDTTGEYVQIDDMRFRVLRVKSFQAPDRVVAYRGQMWPNGNFWYDLAPAVRSDPMKVNRFAAACAQITKGSGIACQDIRRVTRPMHGGDYVIVLESHSNYSYVGRVGGVQEMGIFNWEVPAIIAHEIKHALGWVHEQSRPDRDEYVQIHWANINAGYTRNFDIHASAWNGGPYSFSSIMHYGAYDFSSNGLPTISVRPGYESQAAELGQRWRITDGDLSRVVGVYGDSNTTWCGMTRQPQGTPPEGCFFDCKLAANPAYGRWIRCGTCRGAERCQ